MQFAKVYNELTGANITHKDVDEFGYVEAAELQIAFDFLRT